MLLESLCSFGVFIYSRKSKEKSKVSLQIHSADTQCRYTVYIQSRCYVVVQESVAILTVSISLNQLDFKQVHAGMRLVPCPRRKNDFSELGC